MAQRIKEQKVSFAIENYSSFHTSTRLLPSARCAIANFDAVSSSDPRAALHKLFTVQYNARMYNRRD